MNLPTHLAIIPDGNRRWAKRKNLPSFAGHQAGAEMAEKIFDAAYQQGIIYLTFWAGSISNLTKRGAAEVRFLYELYERWFKKLLNSKVLVERQARVRVLGEWGSICPPSLQAVIRQLQTKTETYTQRHLTFLLAYNGTDEMLHAVNSLLTEGVAGPVDALTFKQRLFTRDLPPVDLVIRTGLEGDPHISAGFMMWDTAEAQLYFTDVTWPDFSPRELDKALKNYAGRERRLGG